MATSLFPNDALGGGTSAGGKKPLLQFRAGRMNRDGKWVKPDARKGLIFLEQTEDSLLHFRWKERTGSFPEEDLIIFPNDAEFKRVPECTTGRVYMLYFSSSSRKLFFWMQEPKDDKDEELCNKLNQLINNPPSAGSDSSIGSSNASNLLSQLLSGAGGGGGRARRAQASSTSASSATPARASTVSSATPTSTPTPTASIPSNAIPADLLSNLASLQVPQRAQLDDANLNRILTLENVTPLLQDHAVQQRLFPFLPERAERSRTEIEDIIRSAEFRQAVSALNTALQSGQMAPLISQLGLDPAIGGPYGGVEAFIEAIRQQAQRRQQQGGNDSSNIDNNDDRMDTS